MSHLPRWNSARRRQVGVSEHSQRILGRRICAVDTVLKHRHVPEKEAAKPTDYNLVGTFSVEQREGGKRIHVPEGKQKQRPLPREHLKICRWAPAANELHFFETHAGKGWSLT